MILIDPHVHLRDWKQAHKETIAHAFRVASQCGIGALFEMPNTDPALTARETILRRIRAADRARAIIREAQSPQSAPFHALYVGLTDNPEQVRHAAAVHRELFPRVIGCKFYAGHSTGRMGVTTVATQHTVWRALVAAGYRGVVAIHAEREDLLRPDFLKADDPISHHAGRPPLAEVASVQTQITLAEAAGFRGTLHICHVSTPETLEIVNRERSGLPFSITAGVTPHHLLLDIERAASTDIIAAPGALARRGTGYTVNPPLRDRATRLRLWDAVVAGGADWIESDHAPHTWEEKIAGAAGLPGIPAFRYLADALVRLLEPKRLRSMTGERVLDVFGIDPDALRINHASRKFEPTGIPEEEYPWNPYTGILPRTGNENF